MKSNTLAIILLFFITCAIPSCTPAPQESNLQKLVNEYYAVYQARSDFQKFLSFYEEDMVLEDIIFGERLSGKAALAKFFDWENPNFAKTVSLTLIIEEQVLEGNRVVTKGYFTPFKWGEDTFAAMYFTTILTFSEAGKIQKQVDWINYPANLVDYNKRKNSNDWIPQGTNK